MMPAIRSPDKVRGLEENGITALQWLFNEALENECIPSNWKRGIIICVLRKGDLTPYSGWKVITLLSVF